MASAPLQLLDLHPDVLFKIFRDFVPLEDKLHLLLDMPEFRALLMHRASYLATSAPFSLGYILFLGTLRSGWYASRKHWGQRMYLQVEETTLHISLFNFILYEYWPKYKPNARCAYHCVSIFRTAGNLHRYLRNFECMEDMNLLTYHIPGYGFFSIDHASSGPENMMFCDGSKHTIERDRLLFMCDKHHDYLGVSHFQILLTSDKKVVVQCIAPIGLCHCLRRVHELSPFTFGVKEGYKYLTWNGGRSIPLAGNQKFMLAKNKNDVEAWSVDHIDSELEGTVAMDETAKKHEQFKKLLWIEDSKKSN